MADLPAPPGMLNGILYTRTRTEIQGATSRWVSVADVRQARPRNCPPRVRYVGDLSAADAPRPLNRAGPPHRVPQKCSPGGDIHEGAAVELRARGDARRGVPTVARHRTRRQAAGGRPEPYRRP